MEGIRGDRNEAECEAGEVLNGIKKKTYRVETFIIPGRRNFDQIFRSTEELDLDSDSRGENEEESLVPNGHEKDDLKIADRRMKFEEDLEQVSVEKRGKLETLEFSQLSAGPDSSRTPEFSSENSNVNSRSKDSTNPEESLCCVNSERDFDKGSGKTSSKDHFKRIEKPEDLDRFLKFDCNLSSIEERDATSIERSKSYDFLPSPKPGNDLKSIRESCEAFYGSCEELCHHGNKNGCTVAAQSPSQVSEEIYKENWMQRLEFLRRRVSLIREKEVILQERERLLLKKEKELKILERLVKEKVQRADLYLKRCTIRNSENLDDDLPSNIFSSEIYSRPSPPPYPEKRNFVNEENNPGPDSRETLNAGSRTSNRSSKSKGSSGNSTRSESSRGEKDAVKNFKDSKEIRDTENSRRLESLRNSTANKTALITGLNNNLKAFEIARSVEEPKDFRLSKLSAYGSWRCRSKPKMSYDDLDSTLSADIGDSSFAVTSKKLDPRLVRKPRGFSRSASERGPKNRPCSLDLDVDLGPDGERVLRKISENISAVVESKGTRFQDYGSIDETHRSEPELDQLVRENMIPGTKRDQTSSAIVGRDQSKSRKERTSFWNEEASDWLRKKRQAYNLATKRMANRDYENKENFGNSKTQQIPEKQSRTKGEKGKKFTIFR